MVEFSGALDERILARIIKQQSGRIRWIAAAWIFAGVYGLLHATPSDPVMIGGSLILLSLGVWIFISPRFTARRQLRTSAVLRAPISGRADEEHVVFESEFARVDLPWSALHRVVVRPNAIVFYTAASVVTIIPREYVASDAAWAELSALASRHTVRS